MSFSPTAPGKNQLHSPKDKALYAPDFCLALSKKNPASPVFLPYHRSPPWEQAVIVSTNIFDGKVRKWKNEYRSTKHGGTGIGLASISAVSKKYSGSVKVSNTDTEFFVDVALKI